MIRGIVIGILGAFCLVLFWFLMSASDELESRRAELVSLQTELASMQAELAPAQAEFEGAQAELDAVQAGLEALEDQLAELQVSYDGLLAGHGYTIMDPTHREMLAFLRKDRTDRREYVEDEYVCEDFAKDVCNNAEENGIRCAFVAMRYPEGGHAIVAFDTIDEGLVYIESQSDEIVEPVVGKHYYQCVIPKPGYRYEEPDYDDTIEKILVVW